MLLRRDFFNNLTIYNNLITKNVKKLTFENYKIFFLINKLNIQNEVYSKILSSIDLYYKLFYESVLSVFRKCIFFQQIS